MSEAPQSLWTAVCETTPRDRRNQRRVIGWGLAWMASWLGANLAISYDLLPGAGPAVAATVLSAVLGVAMALAYWRFLREADELRRQIELGALAVAFAVGVVGGLSYWLLARTGAVAEMDFLLVIVAMTATHGVGVFVGRRRYA